MAMDSPVLSDALFAFASSHLALIDPSYKIIALEARCALLRNLVDAIQPCSNQIALQETNAAASLSFLTSEVGLGESKTWYSLLQGTKHVILSAVGTSSCGAVVRGADAFKTSSEGQWILRNFAYHDIIGSVTLRRKPLLDGSYLEGITDVVDSYLGVATDLLLLLAKISDLDESTALAEYMAADEVQERMSTIHVKCPPLEHQLQGWRCHPDTPRELAALAYAFKSAVHICFYRLVRKRLRDSERLVLGCQAGGSTLEILQGKIQTCVRKLLGHVAEIRIGSCPESALLFPLFLAGGEATEDGQMALIRERLQGSLQARQFQNVSRALQILQEVWDLRAKGRADADWTHILDREGEELLLT